jgi:hypothetical protein
MREDVPRSPDLAAGSGWRDKRSSERPQEASTKR